MPVLVPLDAVPGTAFVDGLRAAWDRGDAVLPLDPRLPAPARRRLVEALRPGEGVEAGDALVLATSGTTGAPRGVVLTRTAVEAAVAAVHRRLDVDPEADRWLACLPLSHVGGLMVVIRAVLTGTPLTFGTERAGAGATLVSVVPTLVDRMDVSCFRVVLVGGAADGRPRPKNVVRSYGMTETAGGVLHDGVPLDGTEVRFDESGRLLLRGPTLLRCFRDGTDPRGPGGWLATEDVGEVVDGRVVVHGRASDMIVTGGENVWPAPVEEVLRAHPAVADAAIVGRPDEEWGERVVAVVVPADPGAAPSLGELRSWVKEHLPAFSAPRELVVAEALPRTALGKLRRHALTFRSPER
ncbi:MAG: AMP-binding protein [Acidimicrobiales bacterium]